MFGRQEGSLAPCIPGLAHVETNAPEPGSCCAPSCLPPSPFQLQPPPSPGTNPGDAPRGDQVAEGMQAEPGGARRGLPASGWGPSSLGDAEQCGLGRKIPDLDVFVQGDRSHLLAVGVEAAGGERAGVMICGTGKAAGQAGHPAFWPRVSLGTLAQTSSRGASHMPGSDRGAWLTRSLSPQSFPSNRDGLVPATTHSTWGATQRGRGAVDHGSWPAEGWPCPERSRSGPQSQQETQSRKRAPSSRSSTCKGPEVGQSVCRSVVCH